MDDYIKQVLTDRLADIAAAIGPLTTQIDEAGHKVDDMKASLETLRAQKAALEAALAGK